MFLNLIYFWWWEYRLNQLAIWTFGAYILVISYILLFYLCCYLLVPDEIGEYASYKDYYFSRLQWFFGVLSATFILDVADTLLKGQAHIESLGGDYLVRVIIQFILCLIAIRVKDERYHAGLAILLIGYTVAWIMHHYVIGL
jgi:hypothetical protein